jgi:hypothetical protein
MKNKHEITENKRFIYPFLIPKINLLNKWIEENKKYFNSDINNLLFLKTPVEIDILPNIYDKIQMYFNKNTKIEEIGGLLWGKFENNKLIIIDIDEVPNDYDNYKIRNNIIENRSNKNTYLPHYETYQELIRDNLLKQKIDVFYYPIHFHTHPSGKIQPSRGKSGDENAAKNSRPYYDKFKRFNCIIAKENGNFRIIFYGENVTPFEFTNEKLNQNLKEICTSISMIENPLLQILTSILTLLGSMYLLKNLPELFYQVNNQLNDIFIKNIYFGLLQKNEITTIKISEFVDKKISTKCA